MKDKLQEIVDKLEALKTRDMKETDLLKGKSTMLINNLFAGKKARMKDYIKQISEVSFEPIMWMPTENKADQEKWLFEAWSEGRDKLVNILKIAIEEASL